MKAVENKIQLLLEGFGYSHKDPFQRTFMNTLNLGLGGQFAAYGIVAANQAGLMPDMPDEYKTPAIAGTIGAGALGIGHLIGKGENKLFPLLGLDKKSDIKKD
jgi:hypothetical protein